jgi:hypothetical protein
MRIVGIPIVFVGGLLWTGVAVAQLLDDDQDQAFQAPGVHAWMGQMPSKAELQAVFSEASSSVQTLRSSVIDQPDFENEHVKIYIGKLPRIALPQNALPADGNVKRK